MSKKFRVGQSVIVGDEYQGVVVGEQHTKKGKRWLVDVDGEEHPVRDIDLKPVSAVSLETLIADAEAKEEEDEADESSED